MDERQTSEFSRVFSQHIRAFMGERGIDQADVGRRIDRTRSYVSEHTSGKRSLDTDIIDAVAELAGVETRDLVLEILRRMETRLTARDETDEQRARRLAAERRPSRQPVDPPRRNSAAGG